MKKIMSCLLSINFVLSACIVSISATTLRGGTLEFEEKIYCTATINDEFADDSVIVVLNKENSKLNQQRLPAYFGSELFSSAKDLTAIDKNTDRLEYLNKENFHQIFSLKLKAPSKKNVLKVIRELETKDYIKYAGPDYIYTVSSDEENGFQEEYSEGSNATPNDPSYSSQTGLSKISASSAWNIATGSNSVRVGVLDSGIDRTHPDLSNRVNTTLGKNFTDDGLGFLVDQVGHGTHVAGIIGAAGSNSIGISGVCWNVNMVSLRVFQKTVNEDGKIVGTGYASWVANAVNYAIINNIPILNYSGGGEGTNAALQEAINNYTGLFICAAGNNGRNIDSNAYYPACYTNGNIISVASTNSSDVLAGSSNYGATSVDLSAPGVSILSTLPDNSYGYMSGTSMAAPHVTGVAALILSVNPNLSAATVKDLILSNVDTVSGLSGKCVTGGRLNAYKAVNAALKYNNGKFIKVSPDPSVFIMAGGAPIAVSDWENVGYTITDHPTVTNITQTAFNQLRQYPADGTFVKNTDGAVSRFAGGAPIAVSSWDNVGGWQASTLVDNYALNRYDNAGAYSHVKQHPLDGTFVTIINGDIFCFGSGNPQPILSWDNVGGVQPSTLVDKTALDYAFVAASSWDIADGIINSLTSKLELSHDRDIYQFTASASGTYELYSTNCTGDVYGELYSASKAMIASDDNSNGNGNFKITYTLTAGQTYYLLIGNSSSSATTTGAYIINCCYVSLLR